MNYLLDTHILIWLLTNDTQLKSRIRTILFAPSNTFRISVESFREIVIKTKLNRPDFQLLQDTTISEIANDVRYVFGIGLLNVKIKHLQQQQDLVIAPGHNDPFDHILISQAISERLTLISADTKMPFYQSQGLRLLTA